MSKWFITLVKANVCCLGTGVSANADPHTKKLRTRVTHIWGYRRRQPNRSAMEGPPPGRTALLITVSSVPGKYAFKEVKLVYDITLNLCVTVYNDANESLTVIKSSKNGYYFNIRRTNFHNNKNNRAN